MDPFAHSRLQILDDGAALGLVLAAVPTDDALCAALACKPFRDALFAQPRHAVRPADKPHPGKRIVTTVAALACSAARLQWARHLSAAVPRPSWLVSFDRYTTEKLAAVGSALGLQWARAQHCYWIDYGCRCCRLAVMGGHLDALRWMVDHGGAHPDESKIFQMAARRGHLEVLRWAVGNGWTMNIWTAANAARGGHLDLLRWAVDNGCPWESHTCAWAAEGGHLDCLKYAREHARPCEWGHTTTRAAAFRGDLEMLRWAVDRGCPFDPSYCLYVATRFHNCFTDSIPVRRAETAVWIQDWIREQQPLP
jgi:hypothetical protein